jgi:hypothetical protein
VLEAQNLRHHCLQWASLQGVRMILCCHITNMTHLLMYLQAPSVFSSGKWLQSEYIDGFLLLASLSIRWWWRKVSCFELWMGTTKRWRKDSHLIIINAWVRVGSAICIAYNGKWTVTLYRVIFAGAMHPRFQWENHLFFGYWTFKATILIPRVSW